MKAILHVIEQLADFGGTPRKLLYLAAYHDRNDSSLTFATYCPSSLKDVFVKHGVGVVNYETLSVWRLAWKIARLVRSVEADVICTHYTRPLIAGFLASRLTGIPFIHNEHSSAHYRSGMAHRLAQVCMPFSRAVICNSNYTAGTIADAYRIDPSRLRVLYNPVEPRQCFVSRNEIRSGAGIEDDAIVIGHVGGMIGSRDQATLLKAFKVIRARYLNAKLWLIGDGPLRASLEKLALELGVAANVSFLGYTDRIGDYLQGMDIYVNPTVDEGFGIAVVEAMLARLPVVLADAGAHPELVSDGKDGLLYTPSDVEGLANTLTKLIDLPAWRKGLADKGEESAQSRFAPQLYAQGYSNIVDEVLTGRPRNHRVHGRTGSWN